MSDLEVPETEPAKESPAGSVCESMNSDQVREILDKLSISEIDLADSISNTSDDKSEGSSPTKDKSDSSPDSPSSEDCPESYKNEAIDKIDKDIDNNYVNSKDHNDKGSEKNSKSEEKEKRKSKGESPKNGSDKKKKKPFSFLRRSFSKESNKEPAPSPYSGIMKIRVESLPQVFITKYLGCRPCTGIWGAEHTVKPVKEMIDAAKKLGEGKDLSLVRIKVTDQGLEVSTHKENKGPEIEGGLIPVQFVSYGVQDFTFTRVFSFIMVREMSYKAKKMECHAYVCPSTINARKLSLSVALSFKEYAKSLEGKQFRFQVELGQKPVIDERLTVESEDKQEDEEEC